MVHCKKNNKKKNTKAWNMQNYHMECFFMSFEGFWFHWQCSGLSLPLCSELHCCWLRRYCKWFILKLFTPQGEWLRAACERCGRVWGGSQPSSGGPEGGGASGAAAGPTKAGPTWDNSGGQPAERAQRSVTHPTETHCVSPLLWWMTTTVIRFIKDTFVDIGVRLTYFFQGTWRLNLQI